MADRYTMRSGGQSAWPSSGNWEENYQMMQQGGAAPAAPNPMDEYFSAMAAEERRKAMQRLLGATVTGAGAVGAPVTAPVTVPLTLGQAMGGLSSLRKAFRNEDGALMWADSPLPGRPDIAAEALARYGGGRRGPQ